MRTMRRGTPELLVATLLLLVLGWYLWYTQRVIVDLRADARRSSAMFSRIYRALGDPTPGAETQALADLSNSIRTQGVPLILTDRNGVPAGHFAIAASVTSEIVSSYARIRSPWNGGSIRRRRLR